MELHRHIRSAVSVVVTALGLGFGFGEPAGLGLLLAAQEPAAAPDALGLKITVLEGEDGVNIVKKKSAVRPVVEVRDRNNLPVAGASVVFLLPNSGASATFLHGAKTLTSMTDSAGRATVGSMKPVGTGTMKINVTASYHGQTASTTISQTNYLSVAAAHAAGVTSGAAAGGAGLSTGVIVGIVAGVAAAAAVGAIVAVKSGGGGKSGTIGSPGVPVFH